MEIKQGRGRPPSEGPVKWFERHGIPAHKVPDNIVERQALLVQIKNNGQINALPTSNQMTEKEVIEVIEKRFNILNRQINRVAEGGNRALCIAGAPGTGKTTTVERILKAAHDEGKIKLCVRSGVITPISLFLMFWNNRFKDSVIVLDDADRVFFDEDSLSILKAAMDTKKERILSWMSQSRALKEEGADNTFLFEGSIVFITNVNFEAFIESKSAGSKLADHLRAIMSRTMYLDLKLHTKRDLYVWTKHMVHKTHMLVAEGLTSDQERAALDFLSANFTHFREISLRSMVKLANIILSCDPEKGEDWEDDAREMLLTSKAF